MVRPSFATRRMTLLNEAAERHSLTNATAGSYSHARPPEESCARMSIRLAPAMIAFSLVATVAPLHAETGPLQLLPAKKTTAQPRKPDNDLSATDVIAKADQYFANTQTMVTDFTQIGADGRRTDGKLFVSKPGRMLFTYAPPATLEIVADGTSVAIIDRKLHTQDLYFISQTPLKFLLNDHVDLAHDTKILDATSDASSASLVVEDHATFGGTSQIRLTFARDPFALKQWTVIDPQGYETVVSLSDIDLATKPDPALFKINQERVLNQRNN